MINIGGDADIRLTCNDTCCTTISNQTICFNERNFTGNLTYAPPWELAVKYSIASTIMLVAVVGNLTIICLLLRNRILLRTSVNQFILNMSVADLVTALAGPIPFVIHETNQFWVLGEMWCYLEGYIQILVMMVSVTSLAVISFDRMVGVVYPFHKHLGKLKGVLVIVAIWAWAVVIALPFGFYRVYYVRDWLDFKEVTCGEKRKDIHIWWIITIIALNWIPLLVMVICYIVIFFYFRSNRAAGRTLGRREHPAMLHLKRRVVRMMFIVVLVFIVCWLPFQVLKVEERTWVDASGSYVSADKEVEYKIMLSVSHYMIYLSTAINPIIYGLMHQTFKRAFRVTCSCFFRTKPLFVLRKSRGTTRYVWSINKSTESTVYHENLRQNRRRKLVDRLRGPQRTSKALVITPALAAAIALQQPSTSSKEEEVVQEIPMVDRTTIDVTPSEGGVHWTPSEGGVHWTPSHGDLPQRRLPVASTGTLGDLISEVIEEESSSDIDYSERIL